MCFYFNVEYEAQQKTAESNIATDDMEEDLNEEIPIEEVDNIEKYELMRKNAEVIPSVFGLGI